MTNALILAMLALLVFSHGVEHMIFFWILWWLATFFNTFAGEKWR